MKTPSRGTESILLPVRKRFSDLFDITWYLLAYLIVFAVGCKKVTEEKGLTGVCPMVISTSPADTVTGVSLNATIEASFNEVMDSSTINTGTFILKRGDTVIAGVVTYAGTTATFSPSANFAPNTTYTGTITTGAKDPEHDPLISNYVWTFTTFQFAAAPSFLGSASVFGVFGGSAGTTNQGVNTVINNGGIGTTGAPTTITGFHDGMTGTIYTQTPANVGDVTGGIYTGPPAPGTGASFIIATNALADANSAYDSISPASRPGGTDPGAGELGGLTLTPGIYKSAGATFNITTGNLTLDAKGDPNAVWIFQSSAALTVGIAGPTGARSVIMING